MPYDASVSRGLGGLARAAPPRRASEASRCAAERRFCGVVVFAGVLGSLSTMPRLLLVQASSEFVRHPVPCVARRFKGPLRLPLDTQVSATASLLIALCPQPAREYYTTHHRSGPFPCRANFSRFAPEKAFRVVELSARVSATLLAVARAVSSA